MSCDAEHSPSASVGDWTRLERDTVYENPWIQVHHDRVIDPNGGDGIYGVVHFKNVAIGIVPVDANGWTWLVGQKRYPIDAYTWEIPEGGGPLGIEPLASAKRELMEEVGLQATEWQQILTAKLSNSATDEHCVLYLARGLSECETNPDPTENLSIRHLPLDEAVAMVDRGEITDSLSVMALLWLDRASLLRGYPRDC
jgi:8-oxo-dGTP pyrophosphatase MutT (NUDIX family)